MGIEDTAKNKADELAGEAKNVVGDVTDDHSLQADAKIDQATASAKQAGEHVKDAGRTVVGGRGVVSALSGLGVRSEYAYIGGFASIAFSLISWIASRNKTGDSKAQSDRWGIFIGHWAPTFMALGIALKLEEDR